MNNKDSFLKLKSSIPLSVKLVAVSKTKPKEDIAELYSFGHKVFGENKVQELAEKYEALPKDIEWHMIGHLQTNKVKYIAPFVSLIHSVDSLKLLIEINKRALQNNRIINCLLECYIAEEDTKFGFSEVEINELLDSKEFKELKNVRIAGLMGIASNSNSSHQIISEFSNLHSIFNRLKNTYYSTDESFKELSMGMSGDYQLAIQSGATIIRIGSLIFGNRIYL